MPSSESERWRRMADVGVEDAELSFDLGLDDLSEEDLEDAAEFLRKLEQGE